MTETDLYRNLFHKLCVVCGTDKHTHGYDLAYTLLFGPRRFAVRKVLEFGVLEGASLRLWETYFPRAEVVGVDRDPRAKTIGASRAEVILGDQCDDDLLERLARRGPWDLIVDDAGHRVHAQKHTFARLWDAVAPGGVYVIEDVHTSLMGRQYNPTGDRETTLGLLLSQARQNVGVELHELTSGLLFWGHGVFVIKPGTEGFAW